MDRRSFLASLPALPLVSSLSGAAAGPPEDGFVSLFDGKTLDGWSVEEGPESAFYVRDEAIVVHHGSNFPTWLRSARQYENFDFRCEYFVKGWINSGVFIHAPEHGRNMWCGMMVNLFHKQDEKPLPESNGAIFPLIAPLKVNVKNKGEWNDLRILMDWPALKVWSNGELVQDLDCERVPELRYRLRRGYLGLESLSYPIRFRNLRVKELAPKETWESLYEKEADFSKWTVAEGKATWETMAGVLRSDGLGFLATKEKFRDFALQCYIRASRHSNGGIFFRSDLGGSNARHYEIQIHDVEGAVYPTGSLYHFKRSVYPRIEPETWYLLQLFVKGPHCVVRVNGETVMEYDQMDNLAEGYIQLQAHDVAHWIEYKQMRIRRL